MSARKKSPDVTPHSDHVTAVITGKLIIKDKRQATSRKRFRKEGSKQTVYNPSTVSEVDTASNKPNISIQQRNTSDTFCQLC